MDQAIEFFKSMGERNADNSLVHPFGTTIQALGVTAGGLIGVFITLGVFFLIILVSDKIARRR